MSPHSNSRILSWLIGAALITALPARSASVPDGRIQEIISRPEFKDARWAMQFYDLKAKRILYSMNPDEPSVAASTIKIFTEGTVFATLGPNYRFHTSIHRTGPVIDGVLKGDLVLVASGDLLLSGRMQADGSLAVPEPDHSYDAVAGAGPIPGDPLQVIRKLAGEVAAKGIERIEGRVLVDTSLFREGKTSVGPSRFAPMSPIMINDNLIDVAVKAAASVGAPAVLQVSPQTAYAKIVNDVKTVAADVQNPKPLGFTHDVANADGSHTITLTGEVPLGQSSFRAYPIAEPVRFAQAALAQALRERGIDVEVNMLATTDFEALASRYTEANLLAEHVSPPISEQVKPMMKVSSNLHTAMFPYLVGAIAGHERENPKAAGDALQLGLFEKAGVDLSGRVKGNSSDFEIKYSPEFFIQFLSYLARQPDFLSYRAALPILGRDGSLMDTQVNSPAAGHVFAKTGTITPIPIAKALAGYIELPDHRLIAFAAFVRLAAASPADTRKVANMGGEALGEIATAIYESQQNGTGK